MLLRFFLFFVFLFTGFYAFYLYKKPKFYDINYLLKHYSEDLILRRGAKLELPERRIQHFKNFLEEKEENSIRIGAFGDSHSFGDEVEKTESYPYRLQQMFIENYPDKKIEVLNFGVNGDGFQAQYFLWEEYRKKYELDYILLGPQGFFLYRDSSFVVYSHYPKHRFILEKEGLAIREVSPPSSAFFKNKNNITALLKKRHSRYYSLIPSWTALRYDRRPFKMWELLFPFLESHLTNPFYYTKQTSEEEIPRINKMLLKRIRKEYDRKILMFLMSKSLFKLYNSKKYNTNLLPIFTKPRGFYIRYGHSSSLGNEYYAKIYFKALTGVKSFSIKLIKCFFRPKAQDQSKLADIDLSLVKSIKIYGGDQVLSILTKNTHDGKNRSYADSKRENTKHFLSFFRKEDFSNSVFFPMSFSLKEGEEVYLKLSSGKRIDLGKIKSFDAHKKFFQVENNFLETDTLVSYERGYRSHLSLEAFSLKNRTQLQDEGASIDVFVGKNYWTKLQPYYWYGDKVFYFKEKDRGFLMMGSYSGMVREKDFKEEFSPVMVYTMGDGTRIRSPIRNWTCKKVEDSIELDLPHFDPIKFN